MIRRALAVAVVLAAIPASAPADEPAELPRHEPAWFGIDVPGGFAWNERETRSQRAVAIRQRDGVGYPGEVRLNAYVAGAHDAALLVGWVDGDAPPEDRGAVIRRELEQLRGAPDAASIEPGDTELVSWNEGIDGGVVEATLAWRFTSGSPRLSSRTLIWADGDGTLHRVTGECIVTDGATEAQREGCAAALASIALSGDLERTAIEAVPATVAGSEGSAGDAPQLGGGPSVGDAPSGVIVQPPAQDDGDGGANILLYVIGGLLLAVAVYYTTRGARDASKARAAADVERDGGAGEVEDAELEDDDDDHDEEKQT